MHHLKKLILKVLVVDLPKLKFEKDHICETCQKEKQIKNSFKLKNIVSTSKPVEFVWSFKNHESWWKILSICNSLSSHGHYFWNSRVMHFLPLKRLSRYCKISVAVTFGSYVMIMGENFKMKNSVAFVKTMYFS